MGLAKGLNLLGRLSCLRQSGGCSCSGPDQFAIISRRCHDLMEPVGRPEPLPKFSSAKLPCA
jgi:hypothetical protein